MIKRRNFTFSVNRDIDKKIELVQKLVPKWAYIVHDKDINTTTGEYIKPHIHFYIEFLNPRYLSAVAKELELPEHMLENVINKKGILEYLTHKNQPDKFQYNTKNVKSNFEFEKETQPVDVINEYYDYMKVRKGLMTSFEFLDNYKVYCATLSFYNRLRVYDMITSRYNVWSYSINKPSDCLERGACPRSKFLVPSNNNKKGKKDG
jgi:hypothetical protein